MSLTVPAVPIRLGCCPECGQRLPPWTPQQILKACVDWYVEHGEQPAANDWRKASYKHPTNATVIRLFGSWNAMIEAAGFKPRSNSDRTWTEDQVIAVMLDFLFAHNRWPTSAEWWRAEPGRPCTVTISKLFGSWENAKRATGYRGLSVSEAAEMLGVSHDVVRRLCNNGELAHRRTPGGHREISLHGVQKRLEAQSAVDEAIHNRDRLLAGREAA